eukprot:2457978-Rhodomonas_salina.8
MMMMMMRPEVQCSATSLPGYPGTRVPRVHIALNQECALCGKDDARGPPKGKSLHTRVQELAGFPTKGATTYWLLNGSYSLMVEVKGCNRASSGNKGAVWGVHKRRERRGRESS